MSMGGQETSIRSDFKNKRSLKTSPQQFDADLFLDWGADWYGEKRLGELAGASKVSAGLGAST